MMEQPSAFLWWTTSRPSAGRCGLRLWNSVFRLPRPRAARRRCRHCAQQPTMPCFWTSICPASAALRRCKRIRAFAPRLPVLMLTVRDQEEDKVEALDMGADDYVTKPFSTRELIARIRTAVRRVRAPARPEDAPIEIGEIRLEPVKRLVTKRGAPVKLTRKEFDILYCLMSRAGRVVTYAKLLTAVWGAECREEVEYLRTFVRQLRKKIEDDPSNPLYLLTDVYVGYRFADAQMFQEGQAAATAASEEESEKVPEDAL